MNVQQRNSPRLFTPRGGRDRKKMSHKLKLMQTVKILLFVIIMIRLLAFMMGKSSDLSNMMDIITDLNQWGHYGINEMSVTVDPMEDVDIEKTEQVIASSDQLLNDTLSTYIAQTHEQLLKLEQMISKNVRGQQVNDQESNIATKKDPIIKNQSDVSKSQKNPTRETSKDGSTAQSKFAYITIITACAPDSKKPDYIKYIYNAIVTKNLLRIYQSKADVVMMVRMHKDTNHTQLPENHASLLTKSGIIIKYIPKPMVENYRSALMEKFRVLELDEYERVVYLEADVMPLNNLDYLFEKSVGPNAVLEENVVIAFMKEPAVRTLFMLKPNKDDYKEISEIIEETSKEDYVFDTKVGYGHEIVPPDHWNSI